MEKELRDDPEKLRQWCMLKSLERYGLQDSKTWRAIVGLDNESVS